MIVILGGTKDSREIASLLIEKGYRVLVTVVSDYGEELAMASKAKVIAKAMTDEELASLLEECKAEVLIDCTHPYAVNISLNAQKAAKKSKVKYLRYERPSYEVRPKELKYFTVQDYQEAANLAAELGQNIFLTIGSRNLEVFLKHPKLQAKNIIARVLPEMSVLSVCGTLGLKAGNIIAMRGPFSHELNVAMFKDTKADVVISKDGGVIGGVDTKLSAACELNIPVIMVKRPSIVYENKVSTYDEIFKKLEHV